ncbi:MAG: outer membrane protein assembly factor BamA [Nitrospirae bacterium]|nr:outer membrane protein assembly factor BamA [Magnetococcales bacterium]HAT48723.1 outer membrane protein assembly factor BamA [Alphaproteobacteria bacterium]
MKMAYYKIFPSTLVLLFVLVLAVPNGALAGDLIRGVVVEGAGRVEQDTIRSHLELQEGDRFEAAKIRKSIEALFATGFFKDVAVDRRGDDLVVRVTENPVVNEITYEGNDAFGKEELDKLVQVKPSTIYNRAKTDRDLAALRQAYRIKGLFLAKIDLLVNPGEANQVNLVYRIDEGAKSKVARVKIVGNSQLSDKELIKDLMIKPSGWFSWFTDDDTYDREKLIFDQSQLRKAYLDAGFVRVQVDSSVAELTPDRSAFVVTHTVHEGKRYTFGPVEITGDFDELPNDVLREELKFRDGDWYSKSKLMTSMEKLNDRIGDFGYAFLDIQPDTQIDDDKLVVSVNFKVKKGQRVYLNRIEVSGNDRTRDEVIRREVRMTEGDLFSASKLRRSKVRLKQLNFFENIEILTPPAQGREKVDIHVKVEEKPTGTFSIGGGYSSTENFLGTASISQNNFMGRGQKLVLSFMLSGITQDYSLGFTEPYFLGKNLSAGFDIFNKKTDQRSVSSYKQDSFGGTLRLGFPISENLRSNASYSYTHTDIQEIGLGASSAIRAMVEKSPYDQSMVSHAFVWDDLDDPVFPSEGRKHKLITDYSGLGGDVTFARLVADSEMYYPFTFDDAWVGHIRGRAGVADGLGEQIPIFERFQLGGASTVRGFNRGGIGPRTVEGDAYGGVHFEQVNAELLFPVLDLKEKGVRGLLFVDTAYLGDWDLPTNVPDSGGIRVSTGIGINWNSPFGPLKMVLGTPLVKEDFDETRIFDFTMGTTL